MLNSGGVDAVNALMKTLVRVDQPVPEELPDELEDYLTDTIAMPAWADMRKIERDERALNAGAMPTPRRCAACWPTANR